MDKIQAWFADLGVDNTQSTKEDVQQAAPEIRDDAADGIAKGIGGLSPRCSSSPSRPSARCSCSRTGRSCARFINRHLGVPEPVGDVVTTNVAKSLRSYFLGVSIIAAFNAVVIGGAALIVGVPLAGTIAVVSSSARSSRSSARGSRAPSRS